MSISLKTAEQTYRIMDGIYRLHNDLFQIQHAISRGSWLQARLTRIRTNDVYGVALIGLATLVPVFVALGQIAWGDPPAVVIYVFIVVLIAIWIFQWLDARDVDKQLQALGGESSFESLEKKVDFIFEEVSSYVNRHRLLEAIVEEFPSVIESAAGDDKKEVLNHRLKRYREIQEDCRNQVSYYGLASNTLVASGKRTKELHDTLLDWADAIPGLRAEIEAAAATLGQPAKKSEKEGKWSDDNETKRATSGKEEDEA